MSHTLVIDNYDSFTYNLVQALLVLGTEVTVRYNDETTPQDALALDPTHLLISPGPGRPEGAGQSMKVIEALSGSVPTLGVCLGHQAIGALFGGTVDAARTLMHGKASDVYHDGQTIFTGLPNPFLAGRYHSLAVVEDDLGPDLVVTARTAEGEIMGIRHRSLPVEGVQFHPESVLTPLGDRLLANFLRMSPDDRTDGSAKEEPA